MQIYSRQAEPMPHTSTGRGRPRLEPTDERTLQAALELRRAKGPVALNIDSVAARSGVVRTTIHRRYPAGRVDERGPGATPPAADLPVGEKVR